MRFIIPADLNLGVGGWVEDAERGEPQAMSESDLEELAHPAARSPY